MAGQDDVLLACTIGDLPWLKRGLSRKLDPNSTDKEVGLVCGILISELFCFIVCECCVVLEENACVF